LNSTSNALRFTLKLAVCLVLVAWILHVISADEAQLQVKDWDSLSFGEQVLKSWTIGSAGLWKTISGVSVCWLLVSLIFMNAISIGLLVTRVSSLEVTRE